MKSSYDEAFRRELRALVSKGGGTTSQTAEVVDVACHAADECVAALIRLTEGAATSGVRLVATELALQLAHDRLDFLLKDLQRLSLLFGFTRSSTGASTNG